MCAYQQEEATGNGARSSILQGIPGLFRPGSGIRLREIFPAGNEKQRDRKGGRQIIGDRLRRCQHGCGIEEAPEQEQYWQVDDSTEVFRDLDSINAYHELTEKGIFTKEEILRRIRYKGRDNARTPFQWNEEENAGFTTGTPWIMVNPNYKEINAKEQLAREDSVFHYFQKLIRLRKEQEVIVYGTYDLLLPDSKEIYAYTRTLGETQLLVICNFTDGRCSSSCRRSLCKGKS